MFVRIPDKVRKKSNGFNSRIDSKIYGWHNCVRILIGPKTTVKKTISDRKWANEKEKDGMRSLVLHCNSNGFCQWSITQTCSFLFVYNVKSLVRSVALISSFVCTNVQCKSHFKLTKTVVARVSVRMLIFCHICRRSFPSLSLGYIFHLLTNFRCLLYAIIKISFPSIFVVSLSFFVYIYFRIICVCVCVRVFSLSFSRCLSFGSVCYLWMRCRAVCLLLYWQAF